VLRVPGWTEKRLQNREVCYYVALSPSTWSGSGSSSNTSGLCSTAELEEELDQGKAIAAVIRTGVCSGFGFRAVVVNLNSGTGLVSSG